MKETKSIQDYLEAIYVLSQENETVHVKDIASFLSVKLPSVTGVLKKLSKNGYVKHTPYGGVTLTPKGEAIGRETWEKHKLLFTLLQDIFGVSRDIAYKEACLMEHCISKETEDKIQKFLEKQKKRLI